MLVLPRALVKNAEDDFLLQAHFIRTSRFAHMQIQQA